MRLALSLAVFCCFTLTACSGTGEGIEADTAGTLNDIDPNLPLEEQISRLPGVYLNDQRELRIRGNTRPPLVVIDGMQTMTSDLSSINPSDVESVEVLKGSETSMYGIRGGGGVIVITTKTGGS